MLSKCKIIKVWKTIEIRAFPIIKKGRKRGKTEKEEEREEDKGDTHIDTGVLYSIPTLNRNLGLASLKEAYSSIEVLRILDRSSCLTVKQMASASCFAALATVSYGRVFLCCSGKYFYGHFSISDFLEYPEYSRNYFFWIKQAVLQS